MDEVLIVNMALSLIGAERITSLSDNTKRAIIMNDIYNVVRKEVLELGKWTFARERVTLDTSVATPDFGYTYKYALPDDFLSMVEIEDNYEYVIEGRYLLTDENSINMVYIKDTEEVEEFTPNFVKAFYLTLAAMAAYSINNNVSQKESLLKEAENYIADARCIDSQNTKPEDYEVDVFLDSRY